MFVPTDQGEQNACGETGLDPSFLTAPELWLILSPSQQTDPCEKRLAPETFSGLLFNQATL